MRKNAIFVLAVIGVLFYSNISQASLIQQTNNGDQVVYDNVNNQYWYSDLSLFADQTLSSQLSGISGLNGFYGLNDWHMASLSEMAPLWNYSMSEITSAFLPSNSMDQNWVWYAGRYNETASPTSHYVGIIMSPNYGYDWKSGLSSISLDDNTPNRYQGAWVVASNVNPVSEPAVMTLLGSIILGLIGYKKIKS